MNIDEGYAYMRVVHTNFYFELIFSRIIFMHHKNGDAWKFLLNLNHPYIHLLENK